MQTHDRRQTTSRAVATNAPREHADATVSFKIVAGAGRQSGTLPRDEFARWAKYEVVLKENEGVKLLPDRYREPE